MLKNLVPKVEQNDEPKQVIKKQQNTRSKNNFKHGINVNIINSATYKGLTATVLEDEFIGKRNVILTNKLHNDQIIIDRNIDFNLDINDEFYYNNRLHKVIGMLPERFYTTFASNINLNNLHNIGIVYVNDLPQIIHIKEDLTFDIITKINSENEFICEFTNVLKMKKFQDAKNTTINKISVNLLTSSQMEFYNIFIYYLFKLIEIYNLVEELNLGFYNSEFINITKNGFCSIFDNNISYSDIFIMLYDNIILPNINTYRNWLNIRSSNTRILSIEEFVKIYYNIKKPKTNSCYKNFKYDDYIRYVNVSDIYTLGITHEDIPRLVSISNNGSYRIIDLPYLINLEELYNEYKSTKQIKFIGNWNGNVKETIYKNENIYLTDELQQRLLIKSNNNYRIVDLTYKKSNDILITLFRNLDQITYVNEKFNPNLKYTVLNGQYYLNKMIFENNNIVIEKLKCKIYKPYIKIGNNYVNKSNVIQLAYYTNTVNNIKVLVQLINITTFIESDEKQRYLQSNETCSFKILDASNIADVEFMCLNNNIKYKDDKIYKDTCKSLEIIPTLLFLHKDKFILFDKNINEIIHIKQTMMISFILYEKKLYPVIIEKFLTDSNYIIRDINVNPSINLLKILNDISDKIITNSLTFSDKKQVCFNLSIFYIFALNDTNHIKKGSWSAMFKQYPEQLIVKEYIYDVNLASSYKQIKLHTINKNAQLIDLNIDDYFYIDNSGKVEEYNTLLQVYKKMYEQDPKNSSNIEIIINRRDEKLYKKCYNNMIRDIKREIRKTYKLCKVVGFLNKRVNLKFQEDIVSIPLRNLKRITLATINDKTVLVELFEITKNEECFISILDIDMDIDIDNPTEIFNTYMKFIQEGRQVLQSNIQRFKCVDIQLKLPYVYFVVNLYKNDFYEIPKNLLGLYSIHTLYEDEKYVYILPEEKYHYNEKDDKYYYIMRGINRGSSGVIIDEIKQELTLFIPTLQKRIALNTKYENNKIKNIPFTIDDLFYYDVKLKNGTNVQVNKITKDYIFGIQLVIDEISNSIKTIPIKFTLNDIDQYLTGFQLTITEDFNEDDNTEFADETNNQDINYTEFSYKEHDKLTHEDEDIQNYLQGFNDIDRVEFVKELSSDEKKIYVYIDKLFNMFKFKRAKLEMAIDQYKLLQSIMKCLEIVKKQYKEKTGNNVIERDIKILTAMFVFYQILNTGNHEIILNPKKIKIKDKLIHYIDILQSSKFLSDLIGDIKHYQHYKKHGDKKYVLLVFFDDSWTNVYSNIESHKLYTLDKEILFYNCIKYVMSFYNNEIPLEYDLDTTKIPLFVLKRQEKKETKKLYSLSIDQYLTQSFDLSNLTYSKINQDNNVEIYKIDINNIKIKYDVSNKYTKIIKTFDSHLDNKINEYKHKILQFSLLEKIIKNPFKIDNFIVNQLLKIYKHSSNDINTYDYLSIYNEESSYYTNDIILYIYNGLKEERKTGQLFISTLKMIQKQIQEDSKKQLIQNLINQLIPIYEKYFNKTINELLKENTNIEKTLKMIQYVKNDYKNGIFTLKRILIYIDDFSSMLKNADYLTDDIIYYKKLFIFMNNIQKLFFGYIKYIYSQNNNKTDDEYEMEYQELIFKMNEKNKELQKLTHQIKMKY
jgi:hypothetical protein